MKKKNTLKLLILASSVILSACGQGSSSSQTSNVENSNSSTPTSSEVSSSSFSNSSISSASSTSSVNQNVTAKQEEVALDSQKGRLSSSELFNIPEGLNYELTSSDENVIKVSNTKTSLYVVHAGFAEISLIYNSNKKVTVNVTVTDSDTTLSSIKSKLDSIKNGYLIEGFINVKGESKHVYRAVTSNYIYNVSLDTGEGVFKDNKVYKFVGTPSNSFKGVGSPISTAAVWRANLFKNLSFTNKQIYKVDNKYVVPNMMIGTELANPLGKAILEQVGCDATETYLSIELIIGASNELQVNIISSVDNLGENKYLAEVVMSDFGTISVPDVETFLATADIPDVADTSVDKLKSVFTKYMNSNSYRIFGADITDSDREIFYNLYSKNQYLSYFMGDSDGYINLDNKVYEYTLNENSQVVLGSQVNGATDYKQIVETLYTANISMFDRVTYNNSQDCFIYVPTSTDNALAKHLLHTCGYDSKGDNFLNDVSEIAFLLEGDIIYVDINLGAAHAYGQIKFQFDMLNSVNMPIYNKPTTPTGQGSEYAGYYVGKGTMKVDGTNTEVESTLTFNADLTGIFTFNNKTYNFTWSAADQPGNSNQVNFTLNITSETPNGEYFEQVYLYKSNRSLLQVKFYYDSTAPGPSWNGYRLQA